MVFLWAGIWFLLLVAIAGLVAANILWFRHVRYLTNVAIARTPVEFATLQAASSERTAKEKVKHIRPEGI